MTTISVDLASRSYSDIGVVVLEFSGGGVSASPVQLESFGLTGRPRILDLAAVLTGLASDHGASSIFLDGPQAWKAPDNGLEHSRCCERELATQGKTGLPGHTKPASFRGFAEFSIGLFDRLGTLGFPRLSRSQAWSSRASVEVYPTSAWRFLGIPPLPAKGRATDSDIIEGVRALRKVVGVEIEGRLTHDELQATVAGVAGSSLGSGEWSKLGLAGVEPFMLRGSWREGYILNPASPSYPSSPGR